MNFNRAAYAVARRFELVTHHQNIGIGKLSLHPKLTNWDVLCKEILGDLDAPTQAYILSRALLKIKKSSDMSQEALNVMYEMIKGGQL